MMSTMTAPMTMKRQLIPNGMIHQGSLILVNARHPCRSGPPPELTGVGENVLLDRRAALLLGQLMEKIGGWQGIAPVSGWRSREEQEKIWRDSLRESGEDFTRQYVALPGHSEHQTGLAIDLGERRDKIDFIRPAFPDTGLCGRFRRLAARYGFILRYPAGKEAVTGIAAEPWHFRYVGAPHALLMEERDLTLEEYHQLLRLHPWGGHPLRYQGQGLDIRVTYLAAAPGETTVWHGPGAGACTLSGNNIDGFVVTQWS